jgi:hypothetical protein
MQVKVSPSCWVIADVAIVVRALRAVSSECFRSRRRDLYSAS